MPKERWIKTSSSIADVCGSHKGLSYGDRVSVVRFFFDLEGISCGP